MVSGSSARGKVGWEESIGRISGPGTGPAVFLRACSSFRGTDGWYFLNYIISGQHLSSRSAGSVNITGLAAGRAAWLGQRRSIVRSGSRAGFGVLGVLRYPYFLFSLPCIFSAFFPAVVKPVSLLRTVILYLSVSLPG